MATRHQYTRCTWNTTPQPIKPVDGSVDDYYGGSADISNDGNFIVIPSMYDDDGVNNAGSVYVWARTGDNTWVQQQKLTQSSTSGQTSPYFGGDNQGCSISSDGSAILIGAYGDDTIVSSPYAPIRIALLSYLLMEALF